MKILLVTNRVKTYALGFRNAIEPLQELGHEVIWAADFSGFNGDTSIIPCKIEQIFLNSSPFHKCNYDSYNSLCHIIEKYKIDAIQCSTPIGSCLARLAGNKKKVPIVIYSAHGFLFFKGAPLINRTIYKWEEKWLAHYTDVLITITNEDYESAKSFKLRSGKNPYLIHGAGIKVGVKVDVDKSLKRQSIGIPDNAFLIVSAGDLNKNKNTQVMVKALSLLNDKNIHYIACGVGPEEKKLEELAVKLGVESQFHLLGYRNDMAELMTISDAFVMMSFREGLPRSMMEAMDLGLPCIGSNTRGIRDLIDEQGGYICNPNKPMEFANAINSIRERNLSQMGEYNRNKVKMYSDVIVRNELKKIYINELK